MKHTIITSTLMVLALFFSTAKADPIVLDEEPECDAGTQVGNIDTGDVTGNEGGSTNCWGLFNGNDPGQEGGAFSIDGMVFTFVAKYDEGPDGGNSGQDIGLQIGGDTDDGCELGENLPAGSGCWAFDGSLFAPEAFLIVIKSSNEPGYGIWLFDGDAAQSTSGSWLVDWKGNKINLTKGDISHITIFAKGHRVEVPEPATLALLGFALFGLALARRWT